ncbi:putative aldouronate transport system substrate-binding protein [Paenibacillus rhizosphaerae]|uniref:Putative aldouronate transport system substrate-binding protein n=1 Tax=Paenibacillus rhizosphaerae TaxID=297318 RepID=A0A839TML5_9BACL|nr:extracellular solute-binding protein [Paenibacillus rhizosphaerae]MBB3126638.1 putative aldouronate transport system substrate-binding protein [Paenibacillus rhizosphaerae]
MKRPAYFILAAAVILLICYLAGSTDRLATPSPQPAQDGVNETSPQPAAFTLAISNGASPYAVNMADPSKDRWVKQLEALTNTKLSIRFISLKDFDRRMPVILAGDTYPDVVQMIGGASSAAMAGSVEAGMFLPLDDWIQTYAPNLWKEVPPEAWKETSYGGHIYGIPAWLGNPSRRATYIRSDLLAQTGLPVPQTVGEFLDVLRAFKKLGVEIPYEMRENFKYADVIFGAYDVLGYQFEVRNGEVVPKFLDEEHMMRALQVYRTMLNEGLIPEDFATVSSTEYTHDIEAGRVGSWTANAAGLLDFRTKLRASVPGAQIDIIPSPEGPEGTKGYGLYSSVINSFYINKHVPKEKLIGILQFFDWMVSYEAQRFFSFGIEGDTYTEDHGTIAYHFPKTREEQDEETFRELLWLTHDLTINRARTKLVPGGEDLLHALDATLPKEGLGSIVFVPELESFSAYPDLASERPNQAPPVIVDHMVKMIYGKEPISDWPKVVREYRERGGNAIIQEATARYRAKQGVLIQHNR